MSKMHRELLTFAPTMAVAMFLGVVGWLTPYPRMGWYGILCGLYVVWLWSDWLERDRKASR